MAIHLVTEHMENVGAELLEAYQGLIRDHLKAKHGVYALYKGNTLYYVGLASNMRRRLGQHLKDRHKGLWDRFSIYITKSDRHMRELEALLLRIVKPSGNRQIGKLTGSTNLKRQLRQQLRDHHRAVERQLVGILPSKRKKQSSKVAKTKPGLQPPVLSQYVSKRMAIRADYKGKIYNARILASGWIVYGDYQYSTPTAPAKEICGVNMNGWWFWKYRDANGEWVRLGTLRK